MGGARARSPAARRARHPRPERHRAAEPAVGPSAAVRTDAAPRGADLQHAGRPHLALPPALAGAGRGGVRADRDDAAARGRGGARVVEYGRRGPRDGERGAAAREPEHGAPADPPPRGRPDRGAARARLRGRHGRDQGADRRDEAPRQPVSGPDVCRAPGPGRGRGADVAHAARPAPPDGAAPHDAPGRARRRGPPRRGMRGGAACGAGHRGRRAPGRALDRRAPRNAVRPHPARAVAAHGAAHV
ncbi:hypothetical protein CAUPRSCDRAFT_12693 [Caulochytrium protostelioides]|uniref:Uncharacterized protein n=1 Tax=Caulochytrium protostelioides TaxID=1555241 RepID=A0A4P9WU94_9FUNG|nr:hypothetical protein CAUPRSCDRAFT_12693 [Caulochytrium protostelioides]